MIRVKTLVNGYKVHSLYYNGSWITIRTKSSQSSASWDADNLVKAMENHFQACKEIQEGNHGKEELN